jgi:predicted negative regulator of RcsB-dependent stress response
MTAKLSKQELKGPDFFQSGMERVMDYISENKSYVYLIGASISVAIIIAAGIYFYWNYYQTSSIQLYARAQDNLAGNVVKPEAVKESITLFQQLIDRYPHSMSARTANYNLGNIYYNQGDIDNAIASYKNYVSNAGSDDVGIKFMALTSLGYCYETKKDFNSALNYFEQAQKNSNGFEAVGYRNIARIHEQLNDKNKALESYQSALQKTTEPSMILFLKRKIASLDLIM